MHGLIEQPKTKLPKKAKMAWRISNIISNIIMLVILIILNVVAGYFDWWQWLQWLLLILVVLGVMYTLWDVTLSPYLIQKHWRYDIDDEFIKLKYGRLFESSELIPMTKVQSVLLEQGPILRWFGLYNIEINTMGTMHEIPGISADEAYILRDQIAVFAKIREVSE
ncbi:PH domain-containing protein [Rummeliibacillus pycnus]|uniref:PH domain-containing protein n=1 Tax=Rummeliibacillus pycnus TaxID=101070 RepID=UPI0037C54EB9